MPRPTPLTAPQLAGILERIPDVVWRYRLIPTAGFEYVSPSVFALTGYTPEEHYNDPDLGRRIAHPEDLPLIEAVLASPEEHKRLTIRWRHKRGDVFATEQRLTVIHNAVDQAVALEGIARPVIEGERRFQLAAADLVLDLVTHRVLVDGRVVALTPAEHRILAVLAAAEGGVPAKGIVARLWGENYPEGTRAVQVHVSNVRRKIEQDPRHPRRLLTLRGGYALARGDDVPSQGA